MKSKIKHEGSSDMGLKTSAIGFTEPGESHGAGDCSFVTYDERIAESNSGFFFDLLENAPDAFFGLTPEGVITYLNPAFETLTGWERNEWIGRPIADIFVEDLDSELCGALKFENGSQRRVFEYDIRLKGGSSLNAEITVSVCMRGDKHASIVGSIRDNTVTKRS